MQGNYRKIQPAPRDDADEIDRQFRVAKRKRQHVRIACNPCRDKKRACQTRSLACIYRVPPKTVDSTIKIQKQLDTLQHSFNHYVDIVEQLKTLPETDALKLLQRLRSPADVNRACTSLQGSVHTRMRLSNHRTAQAILPTTSSRVEFELTALHGIVYPTLVPIDITALGTSPLEMPALPAAQTETSVHKISPASPVVLSSDRFRPLCDSRLEEIDISYWTKVPISNETAAAMISLFLETDQTIVGFIDADLFVESLVERKLQFCSTFLVSAILYVACHACTASDLKSVAVGRLCFQETERLFRAEGSFDDLITLAAINTFSLACRFHGHETLAKELVAAARHMGRRLGLYSVPLDSPSSLAFQELPDDLVRMTAHVAWGTYNWLTIHVLYFHDESIAIPPALPIPGHERHDDMWPQHPLPDYMGSSFTKLCEYFTVIQEVAVVYSIGDGKPVVDHVPIAFAEAKYQKILAWADSLGKDMAWDQNSQEHVMLFHMWFHCAVLDIFRPFVHGGQKNHILKSFSSQDSTPETIFSASLNQLKRLALLYRTQQMPNSYMPYINISLIHIANTICRETNDPTAKFYFIMCIRYWQHLDEADVQAVAQKFEEVALFDEFAVYKKED
ncbi:conidial development protein fluffy [Fusarium bulbicola]|nr:conidial development protein fluffy [Fusarium bulbicola]